MYFQGHQTAFDSNKSLESTNWFCVKNLSFPPLKKKIIFFAMIGTNILIGCDISRKNNSNLLEFKTSQLESKGVMESFFWCEKWTHNCKKHLCTSKFRVWSPHRSKDRRLSGRFPQKTPAVLLHLITPSKPCIAVWLCGGAYLMEESSIICHWYYYISS